MTTKQKEADYRMGLFTSLIAREGCLNIEETITKVDKMIVNIFGKAKPAPKK